MTSLDQLEAMARERDQLAAELHDVRAEIRQNLPNALKEHGIVKVAGALGISNQAVYQQVEKQEMMR